MVPFLPTVKANKVIGLSYTILVTLRQQVFWEGASAYAICSLHGSENWDVK